MAIRTNEFSSKFTNVLIERFKQSKYGSKQLKMLQLNAKFMYRPLAKDMDGGILVESIAE